MAVLSTEDRTRVWRGIMRYGSRPDTRQIWDGLTKTDLQAAVNAADDWVDTNAAVYNLALPLAFRTNATAGQKSLLLALVILMRYNPTVLRALVGEID